MPLASACILFASAGSTAEAVRVDVVGGRLFFFPLCAGPTPQAMDECAVGLFVAGCRHCF